MDTIKRTLKVLEWDTILEHLAKHATSDKGKERCLNAPLYNNLDIIRKELNYTTEARTLLDLMHSPPLGGIRDIEESVQASKHTPSLNNVELLDIAKTIQTSRLLKSFLADHQEKTPSLFALSGDLFADKELEDAILDVFDDYGNVLDSASPQLKSLRNAHRDQVNNLKDKLSRLITSSSISKYLQESVYTIRDDRYVVPVKVEHKAHVPGIVHDVSASGSTLFIEPKAIVELNNRVKELELQIDAEIKRILSELTQKISEKADEILPALEVLTELDFIFAKAKYSIQLKASEPELNNNKYLSMQGMRHPILLTVIDNVIPNDFELGKGANVMIITGSNTGGKTVTLKSVGLFVLMTKAGMHVPAIHANIYPFKNVFADIGDEQSVIQSLSTFSGHMTNIISILNSVDSESLVILDEIGAGTDPTEGSALAQAILEDLKEKGTRTVVSTHYGELKALAYTKEGFINASVEFDTETLKPTYRLLIGIPGKSNAITISRNLGLSEKVVNLAQEIYLTQKDTTGAVLEGLQNTQQELTRNVQEAAETREELEKLERDYAEKLEKIKIEKSKTLNVYRKKYETILEKARAEIREILKQVRQAKSEKIARRALNRLGEIESGLREEISQDQQELLPEVKPVDWSSIKIGDTVLVKDLNQLATLLTLPDKNKNVQIQIGLLKTTVKADKLAYSDEKVQKDTATRGKSQKGFKFSRYEISNTLDLRGVRVDDGLDKLEKYLDDASLANLSPVYIIHGHGTGALKQAIREYLKTSPYVAKFRPGEDGEGGDGVSVVDIA